MGLVKYTPAFSIPELAEFDSRISHIEAEDHAGYESDKVVITIDMEGRSIDELPQSGSQISIQLGWKETELISMGTFTVGNIKPKYKPKIAVITALASPYNADPGNEAKKRRSQTYAEFTLNDIVVECASRLSLIPRVHEELQQVTIDHIDQKNETDLSFLQRVANMYDAVVKPIDGKLVFSRRGQMKTISGVNLPAIDIQQYEGNKAPFNAVLNVDFELPERIQFRGVQADWVDDNSAETIRLTKGQSPFKQLPGRFKSAVEAACQIDAELLRMKRQGIVAKFTVAGNPEIMAEGLVNLTGFSDDRLDGLYSVDKAVHSFVANVGFITSVIATVPIQ